jgi:hypothetical protein
MKPLTYHAQPPFQRLADKAAKAWNRALHMKAFRAVPVADIAISFGPVDTRTQPGRVAQHEHVDGMHIITLRPDITWRITVWQRVMGLGQEDAYSALLHEFGHCLGLPHSRNYTHVMHHELGSTVISAEEAKGYRQFLGL